MLFARLFLNLIYLAFFVIIPCEADERFIITRSSAGSRMDQFIVPRSKCRPSSLKCPTLYSGSTNHDPTQCKCACRHEYSTFGCFKGQWTCLNNRQVRKQPGCQFLFDGEQNYSPLRVLSTGFSYRIIFPSHDCAIDQSASRYRKCVGTWAAASVQSNSFKLNPVVENLGFGRYRHTMKVGAATSLAGRIVSLKVNCRNPSRSSCVLFKMSGQIICPVDIATLSSTQPPPFTVTNPPTIQPVASNASTRNSSTEARDPGKGASNIGESGGSSGTVAAVVIIIILVIIVAAVVGFVIWKRRRGENVLLMDHLISVARKFRSPTQAKKPEEPEEQIYAEIPERPAQRQTAIAHSAPAYAEIYSYAFNDPNSAYAPPHKQNNTTSPKLPNEAPTDERGYMVPVDDKPQHNTNSNGKDKTPDQRQDHQMSTRGGGVRSDDLVPYYDVLESPDEKTTENDIRHTSVHNRQPDRGRVGNSYLPSSAVPGTDGRADSNRFVPKQRRRPPSPPRKI